MSQIEQPKYSVLESEGKIEVRQYFAMIVAEVDIQSERRRALTQGFRLIADYIFGNNVSSKKVAMTAPVTQTGEKIAMTAPVSQEGEEDCWKVRFVMPADFTIDTLPTPKNREVRLLEVPATKKVVIRFSGFNSEDNIDRHRKILLKYVSKHQLPIVGQSITAFYNPPWTLPFLRRNEVMWQLE